MKLGGATAVATALLAIAAPAFAEAPDPICADRPGQGNSSCTVPAGKIQFETTLIDDLRQVNCQGEPVAL